jgi:hypothetical protein
MTSRINRTIFFPLFGLEMHAQMESWNIWLTSKTTNYLPGTQEEKKCCGK